MTTSISPKQAEEMLKAGEAILIDVRDGELYKNEHIIYAASIPLELLNSQLTALADQPKKIIFQCMKGIKSQQACELAKELGDKVYNLEGGINAWKEAGLLPLNCSQPLADSCCNKKSTANCGSKMPLARQMQITLGVVILLIYLLAMLGLSFLGYLIPIIGVVLIVAGIVGCCPITKILAQMPWNK